MDLFTGLREVQLKPETIDQLYKEEFLTLLGEERQIDKRLKFAQNEYLICQSLCSNQGAIARVKGDRACLISKEDLSVSGVKPRNAEQHMALNALLDDSINVVVLTGRAGTGKTLLALAAALHKMETRKYRRLILSKPMSQLGKRPLGILPGEVDDKFGPYLDNFVDNIEHLLNGRYKSVPDLISQYRMEFKPLQLIQGSSWQETIILVDESQVLDHEEMAMLGTRVGEGSKLIIMGDLAQRVETIAAEKTGMYKLVNDKRTQDSVFTASVQLTKIERGPVAELFAEVFSV